MMFTPLAPSSNKRLIYLIKLFKAWFILTIAEIDR